MYASFPFFLAINASYGGWLLAPMFEFAASAAWTYPYAPKDLGTCLIRAVSLNDQNPYVHGTGTMYPNATGNSMPHDERVERKFRLPARMCGKVLNQCPRNWQHAHHDLGTCTSHRRRHIHFTIRTWTRDGVQLQDSRLARSIRS